MISDDKSVVEPKPEVEAAPASAPMAKKFDKEKVVAAVKSLIASVRSSIKKLSEKLPKKKAKPEAAGETPDAPSSDPEVKKEKSAALKKIMQSIKSLPAKLPKKKAKEVASADSATITPQTPPPPPDASSNPKPKVKMRVTRELVAGAVMVLLSLITIFWNEAGALHKYQVYMDGFGSMVSVPNASAMKANEGRLVVVNGELMAEKPLRDPQLGVTSDSLMLRRIVRMYQWGEVVAGGEDKKTPVYRKAWYSRQNDSAKFKIQDAERENPKMLFKSKVFEPELVRIGDFIASPKMVAMAKKDKKLPVKEEDTARFPADWQKVMKLHKGNFYLGRGNMSAPVIGDHLITFGERASEEITVLARQQGNNLVPYISKYNGRLFKIEKGRRSPAQMLPEPEKGNDAVTWGVRLASALLIFAGCWLICKGRVPFIEKFMRGNALVMAAVFSAVILPLVFPVMWFGVMPELALALIIPPAAIAALFFMHKKSIKKN